MSIKFSIKKKISLFHKPEFYLILSLVLAIFYIPFLCIGFTYAAGSSNGLPAGQFEEFAQNNILFYDPSECLSGNSTGICGNTSEEKIWSILRQTLDPLHAAAAFGSIAREGSFQPVKWEYGKVVSLSTCSFLVSWDDLYNGAYDGKYGVGSFGLTSGLSDYLHYVNDKAPDLIQYFKDPSNTCYATGDELAEKIGQDAVDRLIDIEVNYFVNEWIPKYKGQGIYDTFVGLTNLEEAAIYWARDIEVCKDCGCSVCASDSELAPRAAAAQKYYDEYKDFTCSDEASGSCAKLKELRTAMWTKASQEDREDFMYTVSQENYSIAGVEGYMNQALAYNDGNLNSWLDSQCPAFRGGISCRGDHTINDTEQDWINQALNGSNNIKYAVGNATGGSNVGAGKIVCVWDGSKCRDDVDYSKQGGTGVCSVYSPSADFGECWGLEMAESWVEDMSAQCGSNSSSSNSGNSNDSSNTSGSSTSSGTVSGNSITWIGDSYSENSANKAAVEAKYPGIYYNGQSGRMFANDSNRWGASGLNIIGNEIKDDLRDYLVFALGTNTDATSKEGMTKNIDDLVVTVKKYNSNTKIILVSPITNNDSTRSIYDAYHEAMQEAVEKYDNVILADWYDAAKDHLDEYFDDHSTGAYTDNSTHPNTKGYGKWIETISNALLSAAGNGCTTYDGEYPQYDQCGDPRWSNYPYSTDNICGSGCGAASMAMLATVATGQDIFPDDIAKLLGNQYYDSVSIATLDPIVGEHYGFDVEVVSTSGAEDAKTKMRDYLKKGYMIHFTGAGCYPGFIYASGGCTNGHVIGLFDIDENDMVTQANSGMGEVHQKASLDDMAHALIWGIFTAIKGGSGGKNGCSNSGLCNTSSNTTVNMDGLTEEQAQKVADYYNNEATASNFIDGIIPSSCAKVNCVSFSYWFVSAFTDASEKGVTSGIIGDGSYIADTGLPGVGWETGNDPTPYSIFGGAGSSAWSHTGVVVGKTDEGNILTIEAAYCQWDARVLTKSPSYFSEGVGILAYPGNHFTPNEGHLGNKSLKEIIGN